MGGDRQEARDRIADAADRISDEEESTRTATPAETRAESIRETED